MSSHHVIQFFAGLGAEGGAGGGEDPAGELDLFRAARASYGLTGGGFGARVTGAVWRAHD